jgi:molybdopterin-binding aldehyde dehydrogenase-like protein
MSASPALPPLLAANPRLDQWVGFPSPGRVSVSTGRVEIGQGVLTAMLQIAADELDVAPDRILLQTGDSDLTPNEGYTAGSPSIQFGGVALRMACAEVRALFLDHAAGSFAYPREDLGIEDGTVTLRGEATAHDYWSLAAAVDLKRSASGHAAAKGASGYRSVGLNMPRLDLPDKVFGRPARQFPRYPRPRRDGRRSRRRGRSQSCLVGRDRPNQPVPRRGAMAPATTLDRPHHWTPCPTGSDRGGQPL